MARLKIAKTPVGNTGIGLTEVNKSTGPDTVTSGSVTAIPGGVGGLVIQAGPQIRPQVDTGNGPTDGSIIRQKGSHKFLVTDGTTQKVCTLVPSRVPDGGAGQMSIPVYTARFQGNIADTLGQRTSSYLRYQVSSVEGGENAFKVGAVIHDAQQSINGNVVITAINPTVGGYGNVTIAFSLQDGDVPTTNYEMGVGFYASKLTNRWVWDWNGSATGNKYRYWAATPTTANPYVVDAASQVTGFVQIPDAS